MRNQATNKGQSGQNGGNGEREALVSFADFSSSQLPVNCEKPIQIPLPFLGRFEKGAGQ
jgi:hypothetical protein